MRLVNQSKCMSFCCALIFLAVGTFFGPPVHSQDGQLAAPDLAWVTAGLGGGTGGIAGVLGLDVLKRHHLISLRGVAVSSGGMFEAGDEYWDAALLYGRAVRGRRSVVAASAGLAIVGGKHRGGLLGAPSTSLPTSIGLPVAARAAWHPWSFLGFGIYGFANVNKEQSFAGAAFAIELGRLRSVGL